MYIIFLGEYEHSIKLYGQSGSIDIRAHHGNKLHLPVQVIVRVIIWQCEYVIPLVTIGPSSHGGEKPCSDSVSLSVFIVSGDMLVGMLILESAGEVGEYIGEAG